MIPFKLWLFFIAGAWVSAWFLGSDFGNVGFLTFMVLFFHLGYWLMTKLLRRPT